MNKVVVLFLAVMLLMVGVSVLVPNQAEARAKGVSIFDWSPDKPETQSYVYFYWTNFDWINYSLNGWYQGIPFMTLRWESQPTWYEWIDYQLDKNLLNKFDYHQYAVQFYVETIYGWQQTTLFHTTATGISFSGGSSRMKAKVCVVTVKDNVKTYHWSHSKEVIIDPYK